MKMTQLIEDRPCAIGPIVRVVARHLTSKYLIDQVTRTAPATRRGNRLVARPSKVIECLMKLAGEKRCEILAHRRKGVRRARG